MLITKKLGLVAAILAVSSTTAFAGGMMGGDIQWGGDVVADNWGENRTSLLEVGQEVKANHSAIGDVVTGYREEDARIETDMLRRTGMNGQEILRLEYQSKQRDTALRAEGVAVVEAAIIDQARQDLEITLNTDGISANGIAIDGVAGDLANEVANRNAADTAQDNAFANDQVRQDGVISSLSDLVDSDYQDMMDGDADIWDQLAISEQEGIAFAEAVVADQDRQDATTSANANDSVARDVELADGISVNAGEIHRVESDSIDRDIEHDIRIQGNGDDIAKNIVDIATNNQATVTNGAAIQVNRQASAANATRLDGVDSTLTNHDARINTNRQSIKQLSYDFKAQLDHVQDSAYSAASSAMAVGSIVTAPAGTHGFSMGVASYGGHGATAVGYSATAADGMFTFKTAVSYDGNETGGAVSVGKFF
jgi:hypothetical protein